jgi:hypothetical protein
MEKDDMIKGRSFYLNPEAHHFNDAMAVQMVEKDAIG